MAGPSMANEEGDQKGGTYPFSPLSSESAVKYGAIATNAAEPAPIKIPAVCWYILVVELCERLSFYTLAGSQAFFLEHIGFSLSAAGGLNATMWTLCTVMAVVASWVADVVLGRYATILAAGLTYFVGIALAAVAAWPGHETAALYFIGVLIFLPLATAGIKANLSNFGADQYDASQPGAAKAQENFFSVFYCSINVGAGVAYGFFTTFASSGGLGVPKSHGYAVAYGIMACCMLVAVGVYMAGRRGYRVHPLLAESALASTARCIWQSARAGSASSASVGVGSCLLVGSIILSAFESLLPQAGSSMMVAAFLCAGFGTLMIVGPCLKPTWLCAGKEGPTEEELEVQGFLALLPVLFLGSLSFGALYNSMQFWYQQQACQMDVRLGGMQLSGSFFNIADCFAIVIVTPLALEWINPFLERYTGPLQTGRKFGIGVLIAIASVLSAARLEQVRRHSTVLPVASNCAPPGINMSDVKASWMMVPFFLMGVGEIYTQPTLLHFAYSKSPASMRTLTTAASFFIQAVSSALFALLVAALSKHIPNDLNNGHLEYGYFINVGIGIVLYGLFIAVLR